MNIPSTHIDALIGYIRNKYVRVKNRCTFCCITFYDIAVAIVNHITGYN